MKNKLNIETLKRVKEILDEHIRYKFINNNILINNNLIEVILYPNNEFIVFNDKIKNLTSYISKILDSINYEININRESNTINMLTNFEYDIIVYSSLEEYEINNQ